MTSTKFSWPTKSHPPTLDRDKVHIWAMPLVVPADYLARLAATLSDDERARAERYRFDDPREKFIACRGQMRSILGCYVDESPERICFRYGGLGKPSLAAPWDEAGIEFNVSNSGDVGLLAVAVERVLGVDVERIRPISNLRGMIDRYFAPSEREVLRTYADPECQTAFYRGWTRKEAVMKATSRGLSISPENIVVTVAADEPTRVVAVNDIHSTHDRWWLHHLEPADGYIAALASPGEPTVVENWRWEI